VVNEKEFQEKIRQLGTLVGELDQMPDGPAKVAARELVQLLMEVHGSGLERMMELTFEAGTAGEALIAKMDLTLQELAATKPPQIIRVAAWGEGGSVPGKGTLFDAILRAAGGINVAASADGGPYLSFGMEQLIIARPDVIAYASNTTDTPGLNTDLAQHPVILRLYSGRRVTYPSALYSCGVVESANAAVELRAKLLQATRGGS